MFRIVPSRWLCALLCASSLTVISGDWPQFRGENRDGMSSETQLLTQWPEAGPKELWRNPIGEGYSAVTVVGNRIYTMYAAETEEKFMEFAAALDTANGQELWRTALCEKYDTEFGNGPRATPTVDGDLVFVFTARGNLAALNTEDGSIVWQHDAPEEFGSKIPGWGFSQSPLVDGDMVVIEIGGTENKSTYAFDRKSGEVKWTYDSGRVGYNSALPLDIGGASQYVCILRDKLVGLSPEGTELWNHPWPSGECHAMPVFIAPNRIFASGVEGVGAALLEIDDSMAVKEVWQTNRMRNHFSTSIYHQEHIFGFDNATLKCIQVDDGSVKWAKRGLGKGSMIYANKQLLVLSDRGLLLLLDATGDKYTEKGKVQALKGRCWTAPSLSNGKLYLRSQDEIVCYDVSG